MLVDYTLYILYTLVYHELTKLLFFVHPLLQVSYLDGLWGDHKSDISISLTLGRYIYNPTRNNSGSRDYYSRNQQILVIAIGGSKMGGRGRSGGGVGEGDYWQVEKRDEGYIWMKNVRGCLWMTVIRMIVLYRLG